jgi:hypothetical protein
MDPLPIPCSRLSLGDEGAIAGVYRQSRVRLLAMRSRQLGHLLLSLRLRWSATRAVFIAESRLRQLLPGMHPQEKRSSGEAAVFASNAAPIYDESSRFHRDLYSTPRQS